MTSPTSTIPFPVDHMFRMLTLADGIMDEVAYNPGEINGVAINHGPIAVFGRFMKRFAIERFHHFHGERTARMDVAQSVYQYTPKRSYLITCVSPLLFNAPYTRLRAIEAMYLDQWLNYPLWHTLFTGLRSEWHELVLYGTLILNTNVGLLALPARGVAAAAQLSSYISICFGLGSIITGLVLLRLYRSETQDAPNTNKGVAFFRRQSKLVYGFEVLAIFYAMPFGFMVWGMITFILAFLLQMSTGETRGIVFAITSFLVLGITACVWTERSFVWPEGIADIASAVKSSLSRMREGCWSRRGEAEKDLDGADNIV